MAYSFQGKRVLVTGGAGGLGLTIVDKFYESGATVIALDFNQELLDELKKRLPNVIAICVDLSNWKVTHDIVLGLGPLDHLVNNAGILMLSTVPDVSEEMLDKIMGINFKAPYNVSQAFAKNVITHSIKGATIVNISSVGAKKAFPGLSLYCCSKAAMDMLTKCLAVELAVHGIRVNSILPTVMRTGLYLAMPKLISDVADEACEKAPIKGMVDTADAANLVLYLSSPSTKMITGTGVLIDGGLSLV